MCVPSNNKMFYDLYVKYDNVDQIRRTLCLLIEYGYNAVALTTEFTDSHFHIDGQKKEKHKKQAKEISKVFPPINTVQFEDLNLKIYTRANILVNDPNTFQKITQSKVLKQYDIIAYLPGNSQILKQLANITDYDILCFNPSIHNEKLNLNRKLYNQFVQNGIYMELPYSPTISDSSLRKYIIMMAHIYHAVGKSSNIIISSGGGDFRAPYDVINLAFLYGLKEEHAKNSITRFCESVVLRAATRRRGKSIIEMTSMNN